MTNNIGYLIKVNRINQDLTLRELSKIVGISHVQISKYERNIDKISEKNFFAICKALKINYSPAFDLDAIALFNNIIDEIFFCVKTGKDSIEVLKENEVKYLSSSYSHLYLVLKYVCLVRSNNLEVNLLEKNIVELDLEDSIEKQMFIIFRGVKEYLNKKFKKSNEYFILASKYKFNEKIEAMRMYYHSMTLYKLNTLIEALYNITKAIEIFNKYGANYRATMSNLIIGNIYSDSKRYEEAYIIYTELLAKLKTDNNSKELQERVKFNIATQLLNQNKFEDALYVIENIDYNYVSPYRYIEAHCVIYTMAKDYDKAMLWIKKANKLVEKGSVDHKLLKIYELVASKNKTKVGFNSLVSLYKQIENQISAETQLMILKWIIEIAEEREDIESINRYLKIKMDILEYH